MKPNEELASLVESNQDVLRQRWLGKRKNPSSIGVIFSSRFGEDNHPYIVNDNLSCSDGQFLNSARSHDNF
jgi:hypothetical protein